MPVLLLLSGGVNEARVRRRVLRLKLLDRFKIRGVGNDFRKLLHLVQLIQFYFGSLVLNDRIAHDNSSLCDLTQNVRTNMKSTTTKSVFFRLLPTRRNRFAASREPSRGPASLSRCGDPRRRFSCPSRTQSGADKIVSKLPHWTGKFAAFVEHVVERINEHVDFFFADDERRKNFQHVHRVTGYLRENAVLAQHLSHDHLRKEHLVDLVQKLPCHLELELVRFMKLNSHHEAFAAHLFYEGMFRLEPLDFLHEQCAHFS